MKIIIRDPQNVQELEASIAENVPDFFAPRIVEWLNADKDRDDTSEFHLVPDWYETKRHDGKVK